MSNFGQFTKTTFYFSVNPTKIKLVQILLSREYALAHMLMRQGTCTPRIKKDPRTKMRGSFCQVLQIIGNGFNAAFIVHQMLPHGVIRRLWIPGTNCIDHGLMSLNGLHLHTLMSDVDEQGNRFI